MQPRALAAVVAIAAVVLGLSVGAPAATTSPVLGHPWAPYQTGYGRAHPTTVFNGGDPTGLVRRIRWRSWGSREAVGYGVSTYVWPGTAVADNGPISGARIVAFHLGTCRGRPAYDAVEWYFPKYGETFDPHEYINACTGKYIGFNPKLVSCRDVAIANGAYTATEVQAVHMSCTTARRLIATAPVTRYLSSGGRFVQSGFRCGTEGVLVDSALFDCQLARREFLYEVARR